MRRRRKKNSIEHAYDEAVAPNGEPSERAQGLILKHPTLVSELAGAVEGMGHFDPRDAFLAGFTAALVWMDERVTNVKPNFPITPPYYEVTVRLPLDLYSEDWFGQVADAAGENAAVSGSIIPDDDEPEGLTTVRFP